MIPGVKDFIDADDGLRRAQLRMMRVDELDDLLLRFVAIRQELGDDVHGPGLFDDQTLGGYARRVRAAGNMVDAELTLRLRGC